MREDGAEISTSNGSIDLYLDDELNADFNGSASVGNVSVKNLALRSRFTTRAETSTLLRAKIGEGGRLIDARTVNGELALHRLGE